MLVLFLRHAEAEADLEDDFSRRLTAKGRDQADRVARFIARNGLVPETLLTSPVTRAKQTAQIVAQRLHDCKVVEQAWLACGMTPETCAQQLAAMPDKSVVLLAGHEPDFSESIGWLLGAAPDSIKIRKASLTAVDTRDFHQGGAELQFSVPVRLM